MARWRSANSDDIESILEFGMMEISLDRGKQALELFLSYAKKDEDLRNEIANHLHSLERENLISIWHKQLIDPGENRVEKLKKKLNSADIILLLISSDYISSDSCWNDEMIPAVKLHDAGKTLVFPIILRDCDWRISPLNKLQGLPRNEKSVTSSSRENRDRVFNGIVCDIKRVIQSKLHPHSEQKTQAQPKFNSNRENLREEKNQVSKESTLDRFTKTKSFDEEKFFFIQPTQNLSFEKLSSFLEHQQWSQADVETYQKLLLSVERIEENWLRIQDIQKISCEVIQEIDTLWNFHSRGKFGFTSQKNIWCKTSKGKTESVKGNLFEEFEKSVGWMKNDTSVVEYKDFTFSLGANQGHLPALGRDRLLYTEWKPAFYKFLSHICRCLT